MYFVLHELTWCVTSSSGDARYAGICIEDATTAILLRWARVAGPEMLPSGPFRSPAAPTAPAPAIAAGQPT